MTQSKVWRRVFGVEHTVVEKIELVEATDKIVAHVRLYSNRANRCSRCDRKCPGCDQGSGRRRWQGPDLGTAKVELEADAPRVSCPEHGVVVAAVPWVRPKSGFTRDFEQLCAWLAKYMQNNRVAGLRRIGVDEISYKKGHHYLTVVVDHDTGRIVWAGEGRSKDTLKKFFELLGEERCKKIATVVEELCPQAKRCMDPFHVVAWATKAVDTVRRRTVNDLHRSGRGRAAADSKGTRWALLKNPENQTGEQRTTVASIKRTNGKLYTAYLLKEQLREVFKVGGDAGKKLLAGWLAWAYRSQLPEFVAVARTVETQRLAIRNTLEYSCSNARSEATNTHLRQLTRGAYGYRSPEALIARATLTRGGLDVVLPGRAA
ncbi:ISL3 family transposase [Frankia sp. Cr1]|uniref:ISL3 family transposase n=1 Tax=Frankia sp. Cr1 TaxID=3073931 RepID=UPI002AD1FD43|nr:ISL3 family transposase [Frankia sp. Cr1]